MNRLLVLFVVLLFQPTFANANAMHCVQARLNALGFDAGKPDGVFGNRTRGAAEAFAAENPLDILALDKTNADPWCEKLAEKTAGMPGFERDAPTDVELFQYESDVFCARPRLMTVKTSRVINRDRKKLVEALKWFNGAISNYYRSEDTRDEIVSEVVRFADEGAFTRLNWRGSGSSPAHWQSNLLKNIGILTHVIDHHKGWKPGQRDRVARWGDSVYRSTHYSAWGRRQSDRWTDTVAAAAASYMLWGAVAPNPKAYEEGKQDFIKMSSRFRKKGGTRTFFKNRKHLGGWLPKNWGARLEDKTIGDFVIAAHVGKALGDDLFHHTSGGASLYEMVLGWQQTLLVDDLPKGEDLTFMTEQGQERSWSWTEYFIFNFPDDPRSKLLREKSRQITTGWGFGYQGLATGPSSCLFRTSRD